MEIDIGKVLGIGGSLLLGALIAMMVVVLVDVLVDTYVDVVTEDKLSVEPRDDVVAVSYGGGSAGVSLLNLNGTWCAVLIGARKAALDCDWR